MRAAKYFMNWYELPWFDRAEKLNCVADVYARFYMNELIALFLDEINALKRHVSNS